MAGVCRRSGLQCGKYLDRRRHLGGRNGGSVSHRRGSRAGLGAVLNYVVAPAGNPVLIFSGIALVCIAIVLDALAYRGISRGGAASRMGILLSFIGGIGAGLFYPLVAKSLAGPGHLQPYTVNVVFALGAAASALPMIYLLLRRPISGPPLQWKDYPRRHLEYSCLGDCWRAHLGCRNHR